MERPWPKKLLDDIAAGKIDTVVVYKVDRLTRSLADFTKIVETVRVPFAHRARCNCAGGQRKDRVADASQEWHLGEIFQSPESTSEARFSGHESVSEKRRFAGSSAGF